ncbi:DsbA family protein [Lacibacterium aquatile]|uniref:DsbA family protein n=1 Tax=Lacibacterium aquatile TaxID=1168082 RepID=A0ABW5DWH2_9PROT
MNSKLMVGVAAVVVVVVAGALIPTFMDSGSSGSSTGSSAVSAEVAEVLKLRDGDVILGNPSAPITIVEYASLTCPHCASFSTNVLPQVKAEWIDSGKAKLVYRDFPLDRVALRASVLTRCLPAERRYPFIDVLFKTQNQWAGSQDANAALARTAKLAGLGDEQANACVADTANENAVLQSRQEASTKLSVQSTPTIFVNGRVAEHGSVESFTAALKAAQ